MQCNCHGTGVVLETIFPGAVLVRPCDCPAAGGGREKAEQELRMMLNEIRRENMGRQNSRLCSTG